MHIIPPKENLALLFSEYEVFDLFIYETVFITQPLISA